jgi:hypothetical protein
VEESSVGWALGLIAASTHAAPSRRRPPSATSGRAEHRANEVGPLANARHEIRKPMNAVTGMTGPLVRLDMKLHDT